MNQSKRQNKLRTNEHFHEIYEEIGNKMSIKLVNLGYDLCNSLRFRWRFEEIP